MQKKQITAQKELWKVASIAFQIKDSFPETGKATMILRQLSIY
jgi:hypothetical protein